MFPGKKIDLRLLEVKEEFLKGIVLEIQDCYYPALHSFTTYEDAEKACVNADVCLLVGGMPRKDGMERKELLEINIGIFKKQGEAIEKVAKKTCKICVIANPANTNCLALSKYAPSIPKENFSALTRLDHNRALSQVAMRERATHVKNVIIWGNHSST